MSRMARRACWSIVLCLAAIGSPLNTSSGRAAANSDLSSTEIIARFNSERIAAGLSPVTENPEWSASCRLHDAWMSRNRKLQHAEDPGSPGYTEDGNWAGTSSVLALGASWRVGDPWATAPIHLSQMMNPLLATVGAAELDGYSCLTTWPGVRPATEPAGSLAWFPGQGATLPSSEVASESPTVPGVWVGLPEGTETGPYLYLYAPGTSGNANGFNYCYWGDPTPFVLPLRRVVSTSLIGPRGPEEVRVVDADVAASAGYAGYLGTMALFIPSRPLVPGGSYELSTVVASSPTPPACPQTVETPMQQTTLRFATAKLETSTSSNRNVIVHPWGAPLVLRGKVFGLWDGATSGRIAEIDVRSPGMPWRALGTTPVSAAGRWSFNVQPRARLDFRAVYLGTAQEASSASRRIAVKVRAVISIATKRLGASHSRRVDIIGTLTPRLSGRSLTLEALNRFRWVSIARLKTTRGGAFSARVPTASTSSTYRVVAAATTDYLKGRSRVITVR